MATSVAVSKCARYSKNIEPRRHPTRTKRVVGMPLGAVSAADWGLKTIPHSTQKELMLLHQLFEAESEGFE
jgi:hypothetical protein